MCDSLHNNFIHVKFNIHLRSTFKLWNRNVETYKFTSTIESASEEIACYSMDVFICLGMSVRRHWREKQMIMTGICQSFVCGRYLSRTCQRTKPILIFYTFCAQKSRLYKYLGQQYSWERISPLCQVQSTSIQQKSFTPFYNVIFITFDIYHKNYTATQHTHTHIETMNRTKQIQTLYIFVNQIITSQLLAALLLLSLLREKCLNKCFFQRRVC